MLRFRKDITPGKIFNLAVNLASYSFSSIMKEPWVAGMPPAVGIEITSYCNLSCRFCPSGTKTLPRGTGHMREDLYIKIISELSRHLININLYFQGEPMLHPSFFKFVRMAQGINITVSTNGHLLTEENCTRLAHSEIARLIVSLDGISERAYSAYRSGGNAESVIAGLHRLSSSLAEAGSEMKVEVQFLVNRYNEDEAGEVVLLAQKLGFVPRLKSMQLPEIIDAAGWLPVSYIYRRYMVTNDGRLAIGSRLPNRCFRLWFNPVVLWTGEVVPCCFDKNGDYHMGDLNKSSFREIWHGEGFRTFRRQVLASRKSIPVCRNCTSGLSGVSQ